MDDSSPEAGLFHIAGIADWEHAQQAGVYDVGLAQDGFIHLSGRHQVLTPANLWYVGRTDLVLLVIDEAKLTSELVREPGTGTDVLFPHLYGPLNIDAVDDAVAFVPDDDGTFGELPAGI